MTDTPATKWATIKSLSDDFLRYRLGDIIAIFLISLGVGIVIHYYAVEVIADTGKSLVAAGLLALRPRTLNPGGNGGKP